MDSWGEFGEAGLLLITTGELLACQNGVNHEDSHCVVRSETLDNLPLKWIKMDPEDATHGLVL